MNLIRPGARSGRCARAHVSQSHISLMIKTPFVSQMTDKYDHMSQICVRRFLCGPGDPVCMCPPSPVLVGLTEPMNRWFDTSSTRAARAQTSASTKTRKTLFPVKICFSIIIFYSFYMYVLKNITNLMVNLLCWLNAGMLVFLLSN